MNDKIKIAVVGMGDAFTRYYKKVLEKILLDNPEYEIYCADKTELWLDDNKIKLRDELKALGFYFIDASNLDEKRDNRDKSFEEWVKKNQFDLIVIGTPGSVHIRSALQWIESEFRTMIVEKPFAENSREIENLLQHPRYKNKNANTKVVGFSHVRAKLHKKFTDENFLRTILEEIGQVVEFRFFYLEDSAVLMMNTLKMPLRTETLLIRI